MSLARLTTIGVEKYLNAKNLSLFDNFSLPIGVDKENVVNAIMLECDELEILYSDADFFRHAITSWSVLHFENWTKMWNVLNTDYNPLENYDRMEDWTDTRNEEMTGTISDNNNAENTSQISAYNVSEFTDSNKIISTNAGNSNSSTKSNETVTRKGRAHGNIGVTTSQQMLMAEIEVSKINFYNFVAEEFKKQFCVMVY